MIHVYAIRAVLPGMLERRSGYLLHTASMAGILTSHGNLTYAVTKHAVVGLAEWLSITYQDKGIRVSLLSPLGVRTPMLGDVESPFARGAAGPVKEPAQVAERVIEAIAAERFLILTDPIAQKWMRNKDADLERWLAGMRRLQQTMDGGLAGSQERLGEPREERVETRRSDARAAAGHSTPSRFARAIGRGVWNRVGSRHFRVTPRRRPPEIIASVGDGLWQSTTASARAWRRAPRLP